MTPRNISDYMLMILLLLAHPRIILIATSSKFPLDLTCLISASLTTSWVSKSPGTVSNSHCIDQLLNSFNLTDAKEKSVPLDPYAPFPLSPDDAPGDEHEFRKLLGSLMYVMVGTRRDIAASLGLLSQYATHPE
ncbi:hypothetical protein V1515DRAFT_587671 [Lipomyces mesembrius]